MWSQLLAFIAGAGAALFGQALGHTLTLRRERRADFVGALDRAVSSFASGERVLDALTDAIEKGIDAFATFGAGQFPPDVEESLTQAERTQVDMRAALFSIRVRVHTRESPVLTAFDGAFTAWEMGLAKASILVRGDEPWNESLREAREHAAEFRGQFYDVALERAAEAVGRVKA